jgi:predicted XRE-type DNA-binding protein
MKRAKLKSGTTVIETAHPFEGLPDGDERLAKMKLAGRINDRIAERGLKQKEAAELLGITQPEVSNLGKGRLTGFTFDRLYRCLIALDMDIEISVKKHSARARTPAGVHVHSK